MSEKELLNVTPPQWKTKLSSQIYGERATFYWGIKVAQ